MALLLHLNEVDEDHWLIRLKEKLGSYPIYKKEDKFDPFAINYILVWKPNLNAFDDLNNLKAIMSLGAGVDALLEHKNLPKKVPIVRFVDNDLANCMSEYVISHILKHHRLFPHYQNEQKNHLWQQYFPPPAHQRNIGIMGLGELGLDVVKKLEVFGFNISGWARSKKNITSVKTFVGNNEFDEFLSRVDILVNLLPLTQQTKNILNYDNFKKLKRSKNFKPSIINAARGGHQNEADIIKALNDKTLGAASLDVFEIEPLPKNSPLWDLENCYITPHIAAISNPQTGVDYFSKILLEHEKGKPLPNLVDRQKGY